MLRFVGVSLGSTHSSPGVHVRRKARPYTGWAGFDPGSSLDPAELLPELIECARAGVQVAAMTPDMLSVFELVDRAIPIAGLRWVLGHINVLTPADIDLIRRLGLIVTTHTNRYIYKEGREGEKRAAETGGVPVPLRSLLSAGVPVSWAPTTSPPRFSGRSGMRSHASPAAAASTHNTSASTVTRRCGRRRSAVPSDVRRAPTRQARAGHAGRPGGALRRCASHR